ncbi:MAG: histone deacetylase [Desulfobulbaceae bacterium]|nr:histone deacetylase [Desulfobulbaceae bacterium]
MTHFNPITLVSHKHYLEHDTGGGEHPEVPERLLAISEQLKKSPLCPVLVEVDAREPERQDVLAFHDESYLYRFEETALSGKTYLGHPDNQICFDSYQIALLSAGGGITGIDLLENNNADLVFCLVRPPGHHAESSLPLGFCFFNNAVIAAKYWQKKYEREKIVIIDWDAHHGNGIQAAFEEDPSVLYISIHEHPTFSFPGTGHAEDNGMGPGTGTTLNVPLRPGSDDTVFLQAMERLVEPALADFRPDRIIVSAGFDGHIKDDMSGLSYSTDLYEVIGRKMAAWASQYCQGKLLSILEGGYHLESLAESVERYLQGMAQTTQG